MVLSIGLVTDSVDELVGPPVSYMTAECYQKYDPKFAARVWALKLS